MFKKANYLSLFFLTFLTTSVLFAQKNVIKWNKNVQLTWKDFNEKKGSELAYSAVAIKLKPLISNTKRIQLEVYAYFDKKKSRTGIYDDHVLKHEQLHFLIGELFARKLRKKILYTDRQKFFKDRNEFNKLYQENYKEYLEYQKLYDQETTYSVNRAAQQKWVKKVGKELTDYNRFKNPIIDLRKWLI